MRAAVEQVAVTKRQIIAELSKSPHGDIKQYLPVGKLAAKHEPEFLAHLIAWDRTNGQVYDAKVALPVVSLSVPEFSDEEYVENSYAHLALLSPKNLLRAYRFAMNVKIKGRKNRLDRLIQAYLRAREANWRWWERAALQHRGSMKELYCLSHTKPTWMAKGVLFDGSYPMSSAFWALQHLSKMSATEAAGAISDFRIPFLMARGAMGARMKETPVLLAIIDRMTTTELVTNMKALEGLGAREKPEVRAAIDAAMAKAKDSKRSTLKTSRAAESVKDGVLKERLKGLQEAQINRALSIDGSWLVLVDKSGSMEHSIEVGRQVGAILARAVKGSVTMVFFDADVQKTLDATGKTLEEITAATRTVWAAGGTKISAGLSWALEKGLEFDGIVVVSDGGENVGPTFGHIYRRANLECPVYLYEVSGERNTFVPYCASDGVEVITFGLRGSNLDYNSLPNLVKTMRAKRFSLADEIMETPLLTVVEALKPERVSKD